MRDAWVALVAALVAGALRPAYAQPEAAAQAEVMFHQAKDLMAAGKIAEACAAFDASQKLDPTTPTLLNQANCRQQNGQLATAWALYLEVARVTRGATDRASQQMRATALDRAAKLEPRLSTLRIAVPDGHRIPGLEILRNDELVDLTAAQHALPVDGGSYRIAARAPGNAGWSTSIAVAAEHDVRVIEIPKLPERLRERDDAPAIAAPPGLRPAGPPGSIASRAPDLTATANPGSRWTARRKLAVAAAGSGVIGLVTGLLAGELANRRQHDAYALCPDPRFACDQADTANNLIGSGHQLAVGADVGFGFAAAAAVTAGVLWFTGAPESRPAIAVAPSASNGQLVVTASGSF